MLGECPVDISAIHLVVIPVLAQVLSYLSQPHLRLLVTLCVYAL